MSPSLSLNPALSLSFPATTPSVSFKVSSFRSLTPKPNPQFGIHNSGFFLGKRNIRENSVVVVRAEEGEGSSSQDMTITEYIKLEEEEDEEESPPLMLDSEANSRPRRIALFVEPSPFA